MDSATTHTETSRPSSLSSSRQSSGARTPMSLDLSDLPPLITPSPPSNTLLITNLDDIDIFQTQNLETIRNLINNHAPLYSWAPLKSFRRIIAVFYDAEAATAIKQTLDGEVIMDCRMRVYFGAQTPIDPKDQHLEAPKSDKLFFISPPPSPPHGWEMRNEEPPNTDTHAEDLAQALAKLHAWKKGPISPDMDTDMESPVKAPRMTNATGRGRSGSVIVYHPDQHGGSPNLPAIAVEDYTEIPDEMIQTGIDPRKPVTHTMRPPVELMQS